MLERIDTYNKKNDIFVTLQLFPRKTEMLRQLNSLNLTILSETENAIEYVIGFFKVYRSCFCYLILFEKVSDALHFSNC